MTRLSESLQELASTWQAKGHDQAGRLRPGLPETEIERLLAGAGMHVPEEVTEWFAWHDGAPGAPNAGEDRLEFPPSPYEPLPLQIALAERQWWLELALRMADDLQRAQGPVEAQQASYWWEPTWLPIAIAHSPLVVDLDPTRDAANVLVVDWEDHDGFRLPRVQSLAGWVELLLDIPEEAWSWSDVEARWVTDLRKVAHRDPLTFPFLAG